MHGNSCLLNHIRTHCWITLHPSFGPTSPHSFCCDPWLPWPRLWNRWGFLPSNGQPGHAVTKTPGDAAVLQDEWVLCCAGVASGIFERYPHTLAGTQWCSSIATMEHLQHGSGDSCYQNIYRRGKVDKWQGWDAQNTNTMYQQRYVSSFDLYCMYVCYTTITPSINIRIYICMV